jgi:hypothetical protein
MLTEDQLSKYVKILKLSPAAVALLRRIRTSPPVRPVAGPDNSDAYYRDEKIGQSNQDEDLRRHNRFQESKR